MTGIHASTGGGHDTGHYEIRLGGHLHRRWAARFEGLSLVHQPDGTTLLRGLVVDQAALHGLLQQVRDLGVPLVSVVQIKPAEPAEPAHLQRAHHPAPRTSHPSNGSTS